MTATSDHPTSLRGLARTLGVSHVALSKHARRGSLSAGIAFDDRGRVIVTDANAAAAQWHTVHMPTVHEASRQPPRPAPRPLDPPAPDPGTDPGLHADAYDLVARVLVAAALEHSPVRAFTDDVVARMARAGYGWVDDAEILDEATRVLRELVREAVDPFGERDARGDDDAALAAAAVDRRR